jgi:hypothetical protein
LRRTEADAQHELPVRKNAWSVGAAQPQIKMMSRAKRVLRSFQRKTGTIDFNYIIFRLEQSARDLRRPGSADRMRGDHDD